MIPENIPCLFRFHKRVKNPLFDKTAYLGELDNPQYLTSSTDWLDGFILSFLPDVIAWKAEPARAVVFDINGNLHQIDLDDIRLQFGEATNRGKNFEPNYNDPT